MMTGVASDRCASTGTPVPLMAIQPSSSAMTVRINFV
jgi:hypothetical protein